MLNGSRDEHFSSIDGTSEFNYVVAPRSINLFIIILCTMYGLCLVYVAAFVVFY